MMASNNTATVAWLPNKATILDSLLDIVNVNVAEGPNQANTTPVPWRDGHAIDLSAFGGLESLEDRTVSIALGGYSNYVSSNLTQNISGGYTSHFEGSAVYTFAAPEEDEDSTSPEESDSSNSDTTIARPMALYGDDTLTVKGNSDIRFKNRKIMMTGRMQRTWLGGIARMSCMEGIICGGFFTRIFAGPSLTMTAIATGDIYGGAARASGARMHIAGMGYRSSELSNWAIGYYARLTNFTIVPVIGSPSAKAPVSGRDWAQKITFAMLPFAEIFSGLAMIPIGIILLIASKIRKSPKKPPVVGPPRLLTRTIGITQQTAGMVIVC